MTVPFEDKRVKRIPNMIMSSILSIPDFPSKVSSYYG
jgi:hypothetical protein